MSPVAIEEKPKIETKEKKEKIIPDKPVRKIEVPKKE